MVTEYSEEIATSGDALLAMTEYSVNEIATSGDALLAMTYTTTSF